MFLGDVDADFNIIKVVARDGIGDGRGHHFRSDSIQFEHRKVVGAEHFSFQRVPQRERHVLHEAGLLGSRNAGLQNAVHDGDRCASTPRFALQESIPAQAQITRVRCLTRTVGDLCGQVEGVATHDDRILGQGLLNRSLLVHQPLNINGHLSLEHPGFREVKALGAVVIFQDDIEFTLDQSSQG